MKDFYEIKLKSNETRIKIGNYTIVFKNGGAGTDLAVSKLQRLEKFLSKKLEILQENASKKEDFDELESVLKQYDEIEQKMSDSIRGYFSGADDVSKKWIDGLSITELSTLLVNIKEAETNDTNS